MRTIVKDDFVSHFEAETFAEEKELDDVYDTCLKSVPEMIYALRNEDRFFAMLMIARQIAYDVEDWILMGLEDQKDEEE